MDDPNAQKPVDPMAPATGGQTDTQSPVVGDAGATTQTPAPTYEPPTMGGAVGPTATTTTEPTATETPVVTPEAPAAPVAEEKPEDTGMPPAGAPPAPTV